MSNARTLTPSEQVLIVENLGAVYYFVERYKKLWESYLHPDEANSAAMLRVCEVVKKYDKKKSKWNTFVGTCLLFHFQNLSRAASKRVNLKASDEINSETAYYEENFECLF